MSTDAAAHPSARRRRGPACCAAAFLALIALAGCSSRQPAADEALADDFVAPDFLAPETADQPAPGPEAARVPLDEPPVAELGELAILRPRVMLLPTSAALYVTVVNRGAAAERLVRAASPSAALIELHESVVQDGAMRMIAHDDGFVLAPGGHLALEPGGKHGMIIEARPPEGAESIAITLSFEHAGDVTVDAPLMTASEILEGGRR